ncbi:PASTA domain-containing protein [bacterium]|nr:PASTA domain-containing protein [bacterium]
MFSSKHINRLVIVALLWVAAIVIVQARLVAIQVFSAKQLKQRAINQQVKSKDIPARRGSIYDRNGKLLARDNIFYDIVADPQQLDSLDTVDSVLCQIFQKPSGFYLNKILPYIERRFVYLERKVPTPIAQKIKSKKIDGIYFTPFYSRSYPYGSLASTLIGCVNNDGKGIAGIELMYDSLLAGIPTQKLIFTDGFGDGYPLLCYSTGEPIPGNDIYLTIDIELQGIVETELKKRLKETEANSACTILLNPHTGEVLSMTSLPNFDPNDYIKYPLKMRRNRNITDPYEPGSIFKLVTFAGALQENLITTLDTIDTHNGTIRICGRTVTDVHSIGKTPARDIMIHSSNVGITLIAQNFDKATFYKYIKLFGFGTPTNIDLNAESSGILRPPSKWWGTTMATLPMGYEVSATSIQIASAYGAVANDGVLMRPYVVDKISKFNDDRVIDKKPLRIRRVISRWVADTLSQIFREVVTHGTAVKANSNIIKIAGKTGTSHKTLIGEKGYRTDSYFASFVGYAPYDDPYIVGLVVIDDPKTKNHYGGYVASPVFRNVLEKAISAGIFPSPSSQKLFVYQRNRNRDKLVSVPNLIRTTPEQAREILKMRNLDAKIYGVGNVVIDQSPEQGRVVEPNSVIILHLHQLLADSKDTTAVPDLVGLPLRKAIELLSEHNIPMRIQGRGIVIKQLPEPDSIIDSNSVCILVCEPKGEFFDTQKTKNNYREN